MTEFLTADQVLQYQAKIDPREPLIDRGKLEGAVGRPQASFGGVYLHASIFEQAAALLDGLVSAHAFRGANKRTAWVSTVVFLHMNGVQLRPLPDKVVVSFVKAIAKHVYTLPDIAMWLAAHDVENRRPL